MINRRTAWLLVLLAVIINTSASYLGGYPFGLAESFLTDVKFYANQVFWLALCFTVAGGILRNDK